MDVRGGFSFARQRAMNSLLLDGINFDAPLWIGSARSFCFSYASAIWPSPHVLTRLSVNQHPDLYPDSRTLCAARIPRTWRGHGCFAQRRAGPVSRQGKMTGLAKRLARRCYGASSNTTI